MRMKGEGLRRRTIGLIVSLLLHLAALLWLLTMREAVSTATPETPLTMVDLPEVVPEIILPPKPEPKIAEREPARLVKSGGGRIARAARKDLPTPMTIDMPVPIIDLPVPLELPAPTAPVIGPIIAGNGGQGTGSGTGKGAGDGSGSGDGVGSGSGAGGASKLQLLGAADWIRRPSHAQMEEYNPIRASMEHVSGSAFLACRVDKARRARSCKVLEERPKLYGFGAAAIKVSYVVLIKLPAVDGVTQKNARVGFWVTFVNPKPKPKIKTEAAGATSASPS